MAGCVTNRGQLLTLFTSFTLSLTGQTELGGYPEQAKHLPACLVIKFPLGPHLDLEKLGSLSLVNLSSPPPPGLRESRAQDGKSRHREVRFQNKLRQLMFLKSDHDPEQRRHSGSGRAPVPGGLR